MTNSFLSLLILNVFYTFIFICLNKIGSSHLQTGCKRSVEEGICGTVVAQSSTRGLWDWRFLYINFLCMVACLCSLYKLKGKIIHDIITDIGFKIKKGWNINIDARSIHHDPTLQNDPDVFNPSRFPVSLSFNLDPLITLFSFFSPFFNPKWYIL